MCSRRECRQDKDAADDVEIFLLYGIAKLWRTLDKLVGEDGQRQGEIVLKDVAARRRVERVILRVTSSQHGGI